MSFAIIFFKQQGIKLPSLRPNREEDVIGTVLKSNQMKVLCRSWMSILKPKRNNIVSCLFLSHHHCRFISYPPKATPSILLYLDVILVIHSSRGTLTRFSEARRPMTNGLSLFQSITTEKLVKIWSLSWERLEKRYQDLLHSFVLTLTLLAGASG